MADSSTDQPRSQSPQPSQDSALDQFETPSSPPHDSATAVTASSEAPISDPAGVEAALEVERTLGTKDDMTLAALAASSSASLPMNGARGDSEVDLTSPSFILVATLRSQITDLTSQVTSLNSKLVTSYTRIGDFEDDMHDAQEREAQLKAKIVALEKDKVTWEQEIERGGWVERVRFASSLATGKTTADEECRITFKARCSGSWRRRSRIPSLANRQLKRTRSSRRRLRT